MACNFEDPLSECSLLQDYIYLDASEECHQEFQDCDRDYKLEYLTSAESTLDRERTTVFRAFNDVMLKNERLRKSMTVNTKGFKDHFNEVNVFKANHRRELEEWKTRLEREVLLSSQLQQKLDSMLENMDCLTNMVKNEFSQLTFFVKEVLKSVSKSKEKDVLESLLASYIVPIQDQQEHLCSMMTMFRKQYYKADKHSDNCLPSTELLTSRGIENSHSEEQVGMLREKEMDAGNSATELARATEDLKAGMRNIKALSAKTAYLNEQKSEVATAATNESQAAISELQRTIESKIKESFDLTVKIREKERNFVELSAKFEALEKENVSLNRTLKLLQLTFDELRARSNPENAKQSESLDSHELHCLQDLLKDAEGKVSKLARENEGLKQTDVAQKQRIQELEAMLEQIPMKEKEAENGALVKRIADLELQVQVRKKTEVADWDKMDDLMRSGEAAKEKIAQLEYRIRELSHQMEEKDKLLAEANSLTSAADEVRELQVLDKEAAGSMEASASKISQLERDVEVLTRDKTLLQEDLHALRLRDDLVTEDLKVALERCGILERECAEKSSEIQKLHDASKDKDMRVDALTDALQAQQRELELSKQCIKDTRAKLEMSRLECDKLKQDDSQKQAELAKYKSDNDALTSAIETQAKAILPLKDECSIYMIQAETFRHDFDAERESKMILHNELMKTQKKIQELQLENTRLTEDLHRYSNAQLGTWRQRHGNIPCLSPCGPASTAMQQAQYQHANRTMYDHGVLARDNGRREGFADSKGHVRESGNRRSFGNQVRQGSSAEEPELLGKQCPKCKVLLPDWDSLQIHVMECIND